VRRVHDIYLVPGFFGFANLGKLTYFGHVRPYLLDGAAARGIEARVHVVKTHPTASLAKRAARVADTIAATAKRGAGPIHLLGHSSGGMDARLFATPGVELPTRSNVERFAERLATVVAVSTPHHGTPLASFFTSRLGQQALQGLSLSTIYLLRYGQLPLRGLLQLGAMFARWDSVALNSVLLDHVFDVILGDFSVGRRRAVQRLFAEVAKDQALLTQLTPEAVEVFNATVGDRPGVRYGSVVTRAAKPSLRSARKTGLDPAGQALHTVYATLHRIAAQSPRRAGPRLTSRQTRALERAYRGLPSAADNDGIVPTRSQVWGEVIDAVRADHLDVIGHFADSSARPPHVDWLTTGTGFTRERYEKLWDRVLDFVFEGSRR
jgi:triacylglycerol esterase/lipase EstA (alpha/beta hydrolase family)